LAVQDKEDNEYGCKGLTQRIPAFLNARRAEAGDDADVDFISAIPLELAQALVGSNTTKR
jgi:hypothetical protein